ncbi:MAG: hypothetical protein II446_03480, partial [Bacteroidales bacterium]|nr:hypothetical protein [Bacteroidales bacterium]
PYFKMDGDEEIYWGPHNARTVRLSLEEVNDRNATKDDMLGSDRYFSVVISLYEEDWSYLRTLGVVPCVDFATKGYLVFDKLGLALIDADDAQHTSSHKITLSGVQRLPATLSALMAVGESFHSRPGGRRPAY